MSFCRGILGSVPLLLAKTALVLLPTVLSVASRPRFSFQQAQYAQVFPLKPAPFCKLFAGLGSTNKSATCLLLLSNSRSVLSSIFPFTLISGRNCFLSPLVLLGYNGSLDTRFSQATTRRMRWSDGKRYLFPQQSLVVSLFLSLVSTLLFSRTGDILFHVNSSTGFTQDTQVSSISTEEFVLLRYARCVLSRLRCNEHSLLLSSYLSKIGRIENPSCSACGHSSQGTSYLISHCPTTDPLRRLIFGDFLYLYDLWSRPWRAAWLLGPHVLPPSTHPSEGVG